MLTTIKRIVKAGWLNFQRNVFVSMTAIVVMVVTLSVITSTIFLTAVLDATLQDIRDRVDVRVVFDTQAPVDRIMDLKTELEARPEIERVKYTSRQEALAAFQERHRGDDVVLEALAELEDNPLGASLNIQADDPERYSEIAVWISESEYYAGAGGIIDNLNFEDEQHQQAIERLTVFMSGMERLGMALTVILVVVSVLITFNTIRLTIHSSRDEISIMRLVGASAGYIRGPFVISGVIYGSIAAVATVVLFYPLTYWLGEATQNYIGNIDLFVYYLDNLWQIGVLVLVAGIFIGAMSSYLAVKRYLQV